MPLNVVALLVAVVVALIAGLAWRRNNGYFRGAATAPTTGADLPGDERERLAASDIGVDLGSAATLVQFSSAFCAPCRATKRTLAEVAELVPGVVHVEIDAEHHLDLVRRLGVMRTPTTFVLDAAGAITTRASGQPRKADVIAALGRAVP